MKLLLFAMDLDTTVINCCIHADNNTGTHCICLGSPSTYDRAYFGQGSGIILLSGVTCNGTEASLLLCQHSNSIIGSTSCSHTSDVAISCSSGKGLNLYFGMLDIIHKSEQYCIGKGMK